MKKRTFISKVLNPLPEDQKEQGFKPNSYINLLRTVSKIIIKLLRLNGENRFSNEFIQALNPTAKAILPNEHEMDLIFRTGHGRLLWRTKSSWAEEALLLKWIDTMPKDACFFDIGSNVGNFGIYAAKKGILTYAFEAELLNVALLYENVFLNGVQNNCVVMPYCLSNNNGIDNIYLKDISKGDALHSVGKPSHMLGEQAIKNIKIMPTSTFKLDDLIAILNITKPTHIKLDVDGNELQIVEGGIEAFKNASELHVEIDLSNKEHQQVLQILKTIGFTIINQEPIDREWNKTQSNYIFRNSNAQ